LKAPVGCPTPKFRRGERAHDLTGRITRVGCRGRGLSRLFVRSALSSTVGGHRSRRNTQRIEHPGPAVEALHAKSMLLLMRVGRRWHAPCHFAHPQRKLSRSGRVPPFAQTRQLWQASPRSRSTGQRRRATERRGAGAGRAGKLPLATALPRLSLTGPRERVRGEGRR